MTSYSPADRSKAEWESTVLRMQQVANGGLYEFNETNAARIVGFISGFKPGEELVLGESMMDEEEAPVQPPPVQVASLVVTGALSVAQATPDAVVTSAVPGTAEPEVITAPLEDMVAATTPPEPEEDVMPEQDPGADPVVAAQGVDDDEPVDVFVVARVLGAVSLVLLSLQILVGACRRFLGRRFRHIHVPVALVLMLTAGFHGVSQIVKNGVPDMMWIWFGPLALSLLYSVEFAATVRSKLRRYFLKYHKIGAVVALFAGILHFVWRFVE